MRWFLNDAPDPDVRERIRAIEVPVLTEAKRFLAREDVAGALRYAYPKIVEDLQRAFGTEFPPGYTHQEILERGFTEPMRPFAVFFDRLYRLYAPVRYGSRPPPGTGQEVLELLLSLYSPEPMWRLYLATAPDPPGPNGGRVADPPSPGSVLP